MANDETETYAPLKQPKSIEDQIVHLHEKHGLEIGDMERAKKILASVNYYRLSAYGIGLMDKETDKYIPGTSIEQLYSLYQFDAKLRNILSAVIEPIEIRFRTAIAYLLAMQYGPEGYRERSNFSSRHNKRLGDMHASFCKNLDHEIQRQERKPFVQHHMRKYGGHFPIWAAIELCSFGMLSNLYSIMKREDKKAVAQRFHTKPIYMISWFASLIELRNICAHYDRIYNMPFTSTPKLPPSMGDYANCRLFTVCLAIRYIVDDWNVWVDFVGQLRAAIDACPFVQLARMGFPDNWEEILLSDQTPQAVKEKPDFTIQG